MSQTIKIELGDEVVGTTATVTTNRWFRSDRVEKFICNKSTLIMGAQWVNVASGCMANFDLTLQLNEVAQACARLQTLHESEFSS